MSTLGFVDDVNTYAAEAVESIYNHESGLPDNATPVWKLKNQPECVQQAHDALKDHSQIKDKFEGWVIPFGSSWTDANGNSMFHPELMILEPLHFGSVVAIEAVHAEEEAAEDEEEV